LEVAFGSEVQQARLLLRTQVKLPPAFFWYSPEVARPETLLFSINMHVDGVQVFDNAEKSEVMPILASIHEVIPFNPGVERRPDYSRGT
jgi:hypothetical protein